VIARSRAILSLLYFLAERATSYLLNQSRSRELFLAFLYLMASVRQHPLLLGRTVGDFFYFTFIARRVCDEPPLHLIAQSGAIFPHSARSGDWATSTLRIAFLCGRAVASLFHYLVFTSRLSDELSRATAMLFPVLSFPWRLSDELSRVVAMLSARAASTPRLSDELKSRCRAPSSPARPLRLSDK
jgi:hypothetical protein